MQLSIGDVVRDRTDMTLGTVAGIADQSGGQAVVLQLSGGGLRRAKPYDLEVVGRHAEPTTTGRSIATVIVVLIAGIAAILGAQAELGSGGSVLLTLMASLGAYSAVTGAFQLVMRATGPRRIRI